MSEEQWVPLVEYPGYSISNQGLVRNDKTDRVLSVAKNQGGYVYVGLIKDKIQIKKSVARLVAETFLPIPTIKTFTTPIHFDGDLSNCKAVNMDWRPRWFAIKHARQFRIQLVESPNPIINLDTQELFDNCWGAVLRYGLLYHGLIKSVVEETHVFPTMHEYRWYKQKVDIISQQKHGL